MNLVFGSFCPLHEGNDRCPCRTLTTNASIWTAAELGDVARVRVSVGVKGRRPDSLDPHGYCPLHLAAQNGRLSVVLYLLEAGASPDGVPADAGGCGATPLHRAAFAGQLPCVRALLSAGASTNAADTSFADMRTPLHKAASQGHKEVCVALMEAGADPNACDAAGNSALDVLCLSVPILPEAMPARSPHSEGSSGAAGGGGSEACSIVVLSSGAGNNWGGVREALERHGGLRRMRARVEGLGNAGSGGGGDHQGEAGSGCIDPGARSSECEKESASVLSAEPVVQTAGAELGVREPEVAALPGQETSCSKKRSGVDAAELASTPSQGQLGAVSVAGTERVVLERAVGKSPRSGGGGGGGVPCGECLLPKVVMVRTTCCGGLICKPCARDVCARRQSCRRCRYRGD
ncbi:Chain A, Crystal Structure Of A Designed Full Consensus Ankyrin [Ectocarpus siliculosus]|uniref:Chain A, Crystal Structure Of A Designed Full Consensus Ankyrin n=1 Tax=Ectocarpus siliculosus TaxID=2880 RepID=D7FS07_ECTSI|nr:Chain A, Crystal Structure Of A Designed Full Consensus Ankyrin [Ectocarpus siliculosus]|eukprot:CBJ30948.1 Chain A, Crystal Structure Of A Designed Full Consensus Ankyrin [Ectocarpus siliculosus]